MHEGPNKDTMMYYGEISLTCALLGIIYTAPTGAVLCSITGPKLLTSETEKEKKKRIRKETEICEILGFANIHDENH